MKREKTTSILIYQYKLIDYMEKNINEQNQANIKYYIKSKKRI